MNDEHRDRRIGSGLFGVIGPAALDANHAADGAAADIAVGEGTAGATVAELSICDPKEERPRS